MTQKAISIFTVLLFVFLLASPLNLKVIIECKSQLGNCPKELESKLQVSNHRSLFRAKIEAAKILRKDFLVTNFSMQLKIPNVLQINVIEKKPYYAIFTKSQNKYVLTDNLGMVLTSSTSSDLLAIIKEEVLAKEGEKISDSDIFALKLVEGIDQMYQVRRGTIQNDTLVVDMPHEVRVILPVGDADSQVLLGALRLIYTKITAEDLGKYSQIDMRYKNPVLR